MLLERRCHANEVPDGIHLGMYGKRLAMTACLDVNTIKKMTVMIIASRNDLSTFDQDRTKGKPHW